MNDVKPCPFCGGPAILRGNGGDPFEKWWITCNSCDLEHDIDTTDQEAAVAAWNSRADADRIAALEAALEMYREAVVVDVKMEGPRFMGANSSALRRAWEHDRAALSK